MAAADMEKQGFFKQDLAGMSTALGGQISTSGVAQSDPLAGLKRAVSIPADYVQKMFGIESGNNPNQRTGSYAGLGQFSTRAADQPRLRRLADLPPGVAFDPYNPDHAKRAASGEAMENAIGLRNALGRDPEGWELYMAHQQGLGGVKQHELNPDRPAWENMFNTAEGRAKGTGWSKAAIWGNMSKSMRSRFGSVEAVTGQDFLDAWKARFSREGATPPADIPARKASGRSLPPSVRRSPSPASPGFAAPDRSVGSL